MATASVPAATLAPPWRGMFWPGLVVALLAGHAVLITGSLILAAAMIPGAVTAPAGYTEALGWDEEQALRRQSEALGWTLVVTPDDGAELNGDRRVQLILRDAAGLPVEGAVIDLLMYHYARPDVRVECRLTEQVVLGVYETTLPLRREGLWRLRAEASRGANHFLVLEDLQVPPANRGAP